MNLQLAETRPHDTDFWSDTGLLISRSQARVHFVPAVVSLVVMVFGIAWYVRESLAEGRLVGGGSASGLACGIAAGAVIVFEMLLWPRKALRRLRLIAAKYWMAGHIWLGLVSLPLAIVHSGFHLGGWLPTTFMVLFVLTIFSGLYGLAVQNWLPKWMLRNLPSETIYNQIDYVSARTVDDARSMLIAACGRQRTGTALSSEEIEVVESEPQSIVVGAVRESGRTRGRTLETRQVTQTRQDSEPLWTAFGEVEPFLRSGAKAMTPVTDPSQSRQWFARLRHVCSDESAFVIDSLQQYCDQRRQFDVQSTVHRWLHAWLPIHVALSVAVTVLLGAHVWTALKYW